MAKPNAVSEFLDEALRSNTDDCIIWPFYRTKAGYAMIARPKLTTASRYILMQTVGEPPEDFQAAHSCGKGHLGCVNPKHLRWASRQDNMDDKKIHGTLPIGSKNGRAIMTNESVVSLRLDRSLGWKVRDLAAKYGISRAAVGRIILGKAWAHLQ